MPVYRYKLIGVNEAYLQQEVPGSVLLGDIGPHTYVDITADSDAKADLDEAMELKGFEFSEQDPSNTPGQKAAGVAAASMPICYVADEENSSKTGVEYTQKLSLNVEVEETANYLVQWSAEVRTDVKNIGVKIRVQLDDTTDLAEMIWDPDYHFGWYSPMTGFKKIELTAGTRVIDLDWASSAPNKSVHLRKVRLTAMKVP